MSEHIKTTLDVGSFAVALGTLSQILPVIAALLSIIWSLIRLYEWVTKKASKE